PNCEHVGRYLFCSNCGERFPYNEFDELLIKYFYKGYYYDEILQFLSHHHGTEVCMRTLKSHLGRLNLNRKNFSQRDFAEAFAAISREIDFCCDAVGYRTIWHRLSVKYGIRISRNFVMEAMKFLDPAGAAHRRSRRLRRRSYRSDGPNYTWHVDGYDKLKRYFCP
uniref:Uncharacterized protein n=1 Tax=Clytia hemisphaerica TaxID=252671 RepID=A0A7M5VFP9_9CNID